MGALPFAWARQYGVLLCEEAGGPVLLCRSGCCPDAVLEALRVWPRADLLTVSDEEFTARLTPAREQNDRSRLMMENIGSELDLAALMQAMPEEEDLLTEDDGAPVIRLLNAILSEAISAGASDIHIEPYEKHLRVRFRVDGMLQEIISPPVQLAGYLVSRIKVMARLDIAEKRLPQDGRIAVRIGGRNVDVRVSTLPAGAGERVVMRILNKDAVQLALSKLGMSADLTRQMRELVHRPHGIVLVTGPTGSGKSTTLYAALGELNCREKNILTVEDPVEYELDGIGQTQVNARADMTFSRGLRAILRQDPDVVMIGEIRDAETARIAVQASLTGHLVLSTLHTNTAAGAVERLRDMGVEPFLLASSLTGVLAQRLVRTLCEQCRVPRAVSAQERTRFPQLSGDVLYEARGCDACRHSGYRGRTGIHSLMVVDDALREAIAGGAGEATLGQLLSGAGGRMLSLDADGWEKVSVGITTPEELMRVTGGRQDAV